ncbi:WD40 repeat domain-containing protein [Streptomyces sp. NPDC021218]|uniref:WD40 repeat domain-containing protein n=1 Tax=Streptomyces sp. NPDC021218 TaxID=3365119 RepID=UPI0037A7DB8B
MPLESGLAERIVNDIAGVDPTARQAPVTLLPALELALLHLWRRRRRADGSLTHAAYEKIGEVTGSLSVWCNSALGQLPVEQRYMARRILTALVRPADEDNGIPATRRIVPLPRLRALTTAPDLEGPVADATFDTVLAALTRHRIVTTGTTATPGTPSGEPAAELIHDALIRDWADLRDWVAQDHRFQVWLLRATEQQARHAHSGLPGDLLDGSLLAEGEEWADQRSLPTDITSLLEASRQHQQSALRRTRRINITLVGMLVLALVATGVAFSQRQTVIGQRDRAASAQVAGVAQSVRRTDPQLGRRLAVASASLASTPESWSALLALHNQQEDDALKLPGFVATESDLDSTGQTFAAAGGTRVEFWNVQTRKKISSYTAPARVHRVDLSDDGETAAVSTEDGYTRLIDVAGARLRSAHAAYRTAKQDNGYWPSMAVSPRGTYLMVETTNLDMKSTLVVWDTRTARKIVTLSTSALVFLLMDSSFSPDERVLSLPASGGKPFTWIDLRAKTNMKKLPVPFPYYGLKASDIEGPVVFSPDSNLAAVRAKDGRISVFDRSKGRASVELTGAEDPTAYPLYFSHDGRYIAQNGRIWEVSVTSSGPVMRYSTTQSECYTRTALRFTADDSQLRCAGTDGVVRSLDVRAFTKPPKENVGLTQEGVVSSDWRTLALNLGTDIEIWSLASRTKRFTVTSRAQDVGYPVEGIQLSRDGRRLAVLAGTTIEIWDTGGKKGSRLGSLPILRKDQHSGTTTAFAFSPDDKALAVQAVTRDGTNVLTFWDLTTLRRTRQVRADLGYPGNGGAVFFLPDGKSVIAAPNFGRVAFPSGRVVTKGAPNLEVDSVSDDGTVLYTYPRGFRSYVRLWDAQTLRPTGEDLRTGPVSPPLTAPGRATAVSPDGRLFATVHQSELGYQTKVWDSRTGSELGVPPVGPLNEIVALAFSPDGSTLTSVDQHGSFFTDTIAPTRLIRDLCARSGPLTEQEWKTHIPDIPYRKTC